jgi:diguanylate cyclase (GGDEF)-like protein
MDGLAGVRNEIDALRASAGLVIVEPVADWCSGFMQHICRGNPLTGAVDSLIPGSAAFLSKLALLEDPVSEAKVISDFFVGRQRVTAFAYGLFMAMEAFAAGFNKAAAIMAVPLQATLERMSDEPEPSWKLALSALLAEEPQDADDFFSSAQVLARQMDRLLLVWQILRCRSGLTLRRELQDKVEIDLLILELDEYMAMRLPHDDRERFLTLEAVRSRRDRMERLSQRNGPSVIIRDALTVRMTPVPGQIMEKVDRLSQRFSSRSEISWSLEALGTVTGARRIQALQVKNGELRIIESYGLGRERLPGSEVADILRSCPDAQVIVDAYGSNPFGSRRFTVIPTTRRGEQVGRERRSQPSNSEVDSFVLLETDSPFDTIGSAGFMVSCFVRQIGSALMLRERETQSYYDAMTGAAIRSSWMKKLGELLEMSVSPGTPLSVLLVDIDRFKRVNDSFGHHEGDRILRETVSAIAGALRPNDIIGRIGGDEFGIVLPSASSDNAVLIADRVCRKVASTVFLPDQVPMTISIGISTADSDRCHSDLLISRADAALYQSKESGRNRVTQWTPASDAAGEERKRFSILDTGDPGWDHSIGQTVMELLSARRGAVSLDVLAGKLRDVLRCEYLYLEDAAGNSAEVGPSFARRVRELVPRGYPGRISEHPGLLGRFYALASLLAGGGWLLAAWEASDRLPVSIRGVFSALVSLSDMLTEYR